MCPPVFRGTDWRNDCRIPPHRFAAWADRAGQSVEGFRQELDRARAQEPRIPRHLLTLAERFDRLGLRYGSHDDPDGDTRERYRILGARICEFRTSHSAAKATGDPVIMRAPTWCAAAVRAVGFRR